jgi:anthranilate phosphoribosyltransferase
MTETLMRDALETVVAGEDLDAATARAVMDVIMDGAATPAQIAAFLVGLRAKGTSVDEVCGMVESMREHATRVDLDVVAVDTCGTGGDGAGTFNISTAAALVVAGAGYPVAKHGNRAASSRCGSADVLEALGVVISLPPPGVVACIEESGFGFLFAPTYHPAMRHVASVRRELGFRTVFNFLGPLANPARVKHQSIGVADPTMTPVLAEVLHRLGHRKALVFTGPGGVDELGVGGAAETFEVTPDGVRSLSVDPRDVGLDVVPAAQLSGGDATDNAAMVRDILDGTRGPRRDVVMLNAAAALVAVGADPTIADAMPRAAESIDSGDAGRVLAKLTEVSNRSWQ